MLRNGFAQDADSVALTAGAPASVERDAEGIPSAFKVLSAGTLRIIKNGVSRTRELSAADLAMMAEQHAARGTAIPVDAEHFLYALSTAAGLEELEVLERDALLGERAAAGFVDLELRADGTELWARVRRWTDRARELLSQKGAAAYIYFSPVIRGLQDGRLRVSSLALTNEPAMAGLDALAASVPMADAETMSTTEETAMEKTAAELALEKLMGRVGNVIALSDAADVEQSCGEILAALEKGKADALALSEAQAQLEAAEAAEKARFVDELKAQGKISEAMTEWAAEQPLPALKKYAEKAPRLVPTGREASGQAPERKPDADDALTMSADAIRIARACGVDPEQVAMVNGLKLAAN